MLWSDGPRIPNRVWRKVPKPDASPTPPTGRPDCSKAIWDQASPRPLLRWQNSFIHWQPALFAPQELALTHGPNRLLHFGLEVLEAKQPTVVWVFQVIHIQLKFHFSPPFQGPGSLRCPGSPGQLPEGSSHSRTSPARSGWPGRGE